MPDDMEEFNLQKLKNEYPDFVKEVSPELLEFILSEKTSSQIAEICLENGVRDEEKIEKIAYEITLILLGQGPKENLAEIIVGKTNLDNESAQKISLEIKRLIFSQIPKIQGTQQKEEQPTRQEKQFPVPIEKEKSEESSGKDTYRESAN